MACSYCRGALIVESMIYGDLACRVCLGTNEDIHDDGDIGHDARPRELRRIAQLIRARQAMSERRARAGVELGAGIKEAIRVFDEALGQWKVPE